MYLWEDWVEIWVYYLYMVDILEMVNEYEISLENWLFFNLFNVEYLYIVSYNEESFDILIDDWDKLINLFNLFNNSMGLDDVYLFVINDKICEKFYFIYLLVCLF